MGSFACIGIKYCTVLYEALLQTENVSYFYRIFLSTCPRFHKKILKYNDGYTFLGALKKENMLVTGCGNRNQAADTHQIIIQYTYGVPLKALIPDANKKKGNTLFVGHVFCSAFFFKKCNTGKYSSH